MTPNEPRGTFRAWLRAMNVTASKANDLEKRWVSLKSALIPLLGKGGARGGSVNSPNNSASRLIEPPLTPPLPRRGLRRRFQTDPLSAFRIGKNDLLCAWFLLDVSYESNQSKSGKRVRGGTMVRESGSRVFATHVIHAALICAGLLLLAPAGSWSQANSATLHGTVNDPTGAVVPGVTVTLTNQNTGAAMVQSTAERGDFTFTFVPVGVYTVRVEAPGFKTRTVTGITLTAGQQARQTFTIELGSVAETVTVEGAAPLVNTVSAEQLHTFESAQVRQLPLQNRNVTGILLLNAGVVPSTGSAQGVNMNGIGTSGTQWSLDGTNASGHTGASSAGAYEAPNLVDIVSTEGVQEVAAIKGVIPAEYENAIGGQVNVISKSGANQWHGSLFENHRNKVLNARFQRLDSKPPLVFNQFGGSLGGPIKKDKIFIFGDYEGYR